LHHHNAKTSGADGGEIRSNQFSGLNAEFILNRCRAEADFAQREYQEASEKETNLLQRTNTMETAGWKVFI
jgi:hypothetical protein